MLYITGSKVGSINKVGMLLAPNATLSRHRLFIYLALLTP